MNIEKLRFHYISTADIRSIDTSDIYHIYEKFEDNKSKRIFSDRFLFSLTNDWNFIRDMLMSIGGWSEIDNVLCAKKTMPIYIYGAGISGSRPPLIFPEYYWVGYIDKGKNGQTCNGLPVYGIEKCRELSGKALIFVSNLADTKEIKAELLELGILDEDIIIFADYNKKAAQNIYFDDDCLNKEYMKERLFVDAGAFDGADTIRFLNWIDDIGTDAIAFEADSGNFEIAKRNLSMYPQVKLYNQGLSDVKGQESFLSGKGEMSNFSVEGNSMIYMNNLDNIVSDKKVGYIKMDIEGFEKKALDGARNIITEQHPVLGISIYHKREDIWEIPKMILDMNPDYKFFLRHYSLGVVDTVLYAV